MERAGAEQAAEALAALDVALAATNFAIGLDDLVDQSLVIPLAVLVEKEFLDGSARRCFAEEDQPLECFLFQAPEKSLQVGISLDYVVTSARTARRSDNLSCICG